MFVVSHQLMTFSDVQRHSFVDRFRGNGGPGVGRAKGRHPPLDDPLLVQALRFIGLDAAQGFKQHIGVLAQQRRTADRDG